MSRHLVRLLHSDLPRLLAERELRGRSEQTDLSSGYVYELVLRATGDEDQADKAAAGYVKRELDANRTPNM